MKSKQITVNDIEIVVHSDGSISKPNNRFKDKRIQRTFGSKTRLGYMMVWVGDKSGSVHRLIAQAFLPDFNDFPEVDHIDGNGTNNDVSNLRMRTSSKNKQGHLDKPKGCSSQYRGVCWCKRRKKWGASCMIDRKRKSLGYFESERDAAIARDAYVFSQGVPLEGLNFPENYA